MSDVAAKPENKQAAVRRQRSIYQVHYCIKRHEELTARPMEWPTQTHAVEVQKYNQQVAGHTNTEDTKYLGKRLANAVLGFLTLDITEGSRRRVVMRSAG